MSRAGSILVRDSGCMQIGHLPTCAEVQAHLHHQAKPVTEEHRTKGDATSALPENSSCILERVATYKSASLRLCIDCTQIEKPLVSKRGMELKTRRERTGVQNARQLPGKNHKIAERSQREHAGKRLQTHIRIATGWVRHRSPRPFDRERGLMQQTNRQATNLALVNNG